MNRIFRFLPLAASLSFAQGPPPGDAGQPPPLPPLFRALDANLDGVIDAGEIANAPAALRTLDKNGDGQLTPDEYRPQRPEPGRSRSGPPMPQGSAALQGGDRKPSLEENRREGASGSGAGPGDRSQGGSPSFQDPSKGPPRPPIDLALDESGDEIIDAAEIAKSASLLLKLDLDGDEKLSRMECLPNAPGGPSGKR